MKGKNEGEMKENNGKCKEKERTEYKMDERMEIMWTKITEKKLNRNTWK